MPDKIKLNDIEKETLLREFFADKILPLAKQLRERSVPLMQLSFDDDVDSYFRQRDDDGVYIHEINFENMAAELQKVMAKEDLPELSKLSLQIVELAGLLREEEEKEEDVSPFIYAMF